MTTTTPLPDPNVRMTRRARRAFDYHLEAAKALQALEWARQALRRLALTDADRYPYSATRGGVYGHYGHYWHGVVETAHWAALCIDRAVTSLEGDLPACCQGTRAPLDLELAPEQMIELQFDVHPGPDTPRRRRLVAEADRAVERAVERLRERWEVPA